MGCRLYCQAKCRKCSGLYLNGKPTPAYSVSSWSVGWSGYWCSFCLWKVAGEGKPQAVNERMAANFLGFVSDTRAFFWSGWEGENPASALSAALIHLFSNVKLGHVEGVNLKKNKLNWIDSSLFLRGWKQTCTGLDIAVLNLVLGKEEGEAFLWLQEANFTVCTEKHGWLPSFLWFAKAKLYHSSAGFSFANVFGCKLSVIEKVRSRIKIPC